MTITDKRVTHGVKSVPTSQIPMGTVFGCTGDGAGSGPFLRTYGGVMDLSNNAFWLDQTLLWNGYQPMDVELIIKGELK